MFCLFLNISSNNLFLTAELIYITFRHADSCMYGILKGVLPVFNFLLCRSTEFHHTFFWTSQFFPSLSTCQHQNFIKFLLGKSPDEDFLPRNPDLNKKKKICDFTWIPHKRKSNSPDWVNLIKGNQLRWLPRPSL